MPAVVGAAAGSGSSNSAAADTDTQTAECRIVGMSLAHTVSFRHMPVRFDLAMVARTCLVGEVG